MLYQSKGAQAEFEKRIIEIILEDFWYGRSNDGKSKDINQISGGGGLRQVYGLYNSDGSMGRGVGNRNAAILQGASKRKPSRAFENVDRNLFEIQKKDGFTECNGTCGR